MDSAGLGIMKQPGPRIAPPPTRCSTPTAATASRSTPASNWFYRPAFVSPTPASLAVGNEKRGAVNGPGYNRLDVGLFRNFRIFEGTVFQLRGEAFNIVNHTNFQAVTTSVTSGSFGQVTSARDNRILQVAGKLTF